MPTRAGSHRPWPRSPTRDHTLDSLVEPALHLPTTDELVALAQAEPGTDGVELSILVKDAYQRVGLGRMLVRRALTAAAVRGIRSVRAQLLPENRHRGPPAVTRPAAQLPPRRRQVVLDPGCLNPSVLVTSASVLDCGAPVAARLSYERVPFQSAPAARVSTSCWKRGTSRSIATSTCVAPSVGSPGAGA